MNWTIFILVLLMCVTPCLAAGDYELILQKTDSMPLAFTRNMGQWNDQYRFHARAGGAMIWYTSEGVLFQFARQIASSRASFSTAMNNRTKRRDLTSGSAGRIETMVIKTNFVGANQNPVISGAGVMEYTCNYFKGNDPSGWHTDVPNYHAVVYENIYPGIDLKYFGNGCGRMEYDFIVSPGVDITQIQLEYEGVDSIMVDKFGRLIAVTAWTEVVENKPFVYQVIDGEQVLVEGAYRLIGPNTFGFRLGDDYDPAQPVVIDPAISYSTYLGGTDDDYGFAIAVDANGDTYLTGKTISIDFPVISPPIQVFQGNYDVFVTKLNSAGTGLIYSTFLGGEMDDVGYDIAIDASGNAYITGLTSSINFPTAPSPPNQTYQGGSDCFVTKINSAGNALVYSTYLGGSTSDNGTGIDVDALGCAYVSGSTRSPNFPTRFPIFGYNGTPDAFVTKYWPNGLGYVYSTFLGGTGIEYGFEIAIDVNRCAYVTGVTYSINFPTTAGAYQVDQGGPDGFVTKINSSGNALSYSTYLGGSFADHGQSIAVDGNGNAYVIGTTQSINFPTTPGALQTTDQPNDDAFVTKLNSTGSGLVYSTYLGGNNLEWGYGITVNSNGEACVIGNTQSTNFPVSTPLLQTYAGKNDFFVTKLNSSGSGLAFSSYLGGTDDDWGYDIAVDNNGDMYVIGSTQSTNFPTSSNAFQLDQGLIDAVVAKISKTRCGDANGDENISVGDAVFLISYIFKGGPAPDPLCIGETNDDGGINIADVVYLISYIFKGGPPPVEGCCTDGGVAMHDQADYVEPLSKKSSARLGTAFDGENTIVSIESQVAVYGLQLEIDAADRMAVSNLVQKTQLYSGYDQNFLRVGLLDIHGQGFIPLGKTDIIKIAGQVEVRSAIGADENGKSFGITILPAEKVSALPVSYELHQNSPNPFNPNTTISFNLPVDADVVLDIFNITGQKVRTLAEGHHEAGSYSVQWNGNDTNGQKVSSGIYFYRIVTCEYLQTRKMVLLK
jgi:hypothetical protein